jgi:hypothetical protein
MRVSASTPIPLARQPQQQVPCALIARVRERRFGHDRENSRQKSAKTPD